jgi:hypothetical protein
VGSCYHGGLGRGWGAGRGRGVTLGMAVAVGVGVGVGVSVAVGVAVAVTVGVIVGVGGGVGVGVPLKWHQTIFAVSTRQPSLEPLLSLAILQRSTAPGSSGGRFTTVVMKPLELPLHA